MEYKVNLAPNIRDNKININVVSKPINKPFFNPLYLFVLPVINPVVNVITIIDNRIIIGCISIFNRLKIENINGSNNRAVMGISKSLIVLFIKSPNRLYS